MTRVNVMVTNIVLMLSPHLLKQYNINRTHVLEMEASICLLTKYLTHIKETRAIASVWRHVLQSQIFQCCMRLALILIACTEAQSLLYLLRVTYVHNIHTIPSLKGYQGSNSFFLSTSKALLRRVFLLEKEVCIGFFFFAWFPVRELVGTGIVYTPWKRKPFEKGEVILSAKPIERNGQNRS